MKDENIKSNSSHDNDVNDQFWTQRANAIPKIKATQPAPYGIYQGGTDPSLFWNPSNRNFLAQPGYNSFYQGGLYPLNESQSFSGKETSPLINNSLLESANKSINRLINVARFFYSAAMMGQYVMESFIGIVESLKRLHGTMDIHKKKQLGFIKYLKSYFSHIFKVIIGKETQLIPEENNKSYNPRELLPIIWRYFIMSVPWISIALITKYAYNLSLKGSLDNNETILFARVLSDFNSFLEGQLDLKTGELIAVLEMNSNSENSCVWWKGRKENGQEGYFPSFNVELLKKRANVYN